jgi:nicotinamide N-methyltransferase
MLTDRITLSPTSSSSTDPEPEDYLSTSLGVIFPDDITNQHGDPSTPVIYTSPKFGKIFLSLADPVGEGSRRLFAQYLWNAGVYVAVGIEDAILGPDGLRDGNENEHDDGDDGVEPGGGMGGENWTSITGRSRSGRPKPEEKNAWDVRNETVLELGAGTGLAGIVAAKAGAKEVIITDYPTDEVLANLNDNVERNLGPQERERFCVKGHEWGVVPGFGGTEGDGGSDEVVNGGTKESRERGPEDAPLKDVEAIRETSRDTIRDTSTDLYAFPASHRQYFSRILLADCLWMPSQHANLHRSISHFLSPSGYAIVVAGFHTGRAKMAPFFDAEALASVGLEVESIVERDAVGKQRAWRTTEPGDGEEGREDLSERKRWLVVAVLRRTRREGEGDGS